MGCYLQALRHGGVFQTRHALTESTEGASVDSVGSVGQPVGPERPHANAGKTIDHLVAQMCHARDDRDLGIVMVDAQVAFANVDVSGGDVECLARVANIRSRSLPDHGPASEAER
jgi:1,4-dihydroxy-2-naphthoyl-CoA synthase